MVAIVATAAGLFSVVTAHAQPGLPPLSVPQPRPLLQIPQPVSNLPAISAVPAVPNVSLPAIQQAPPVLQTPALPPSLQVPQAIPSLPQLPAQAVPPALTGDLVRLPGPAVSQLVASAVPLQQLRATAVRDLLRFYADVLEADPTGEPVRRQELLWVSPAPAQLTAAQALGFVVLREQNLPALNLRQVVLRPPAGVATGQALLQLRALGAEVDADFNHVYTTSGDVAGGAFTLRKRSRAARRVGLVDAGLERQHVALRGADVRLWGCEGVPHPSAHGTAVASLLVGSDTAFSGAATGSALYAADIYCGQPASGAAETIASALAWMAGENVAVVNISLVGPPNRLLERVVQAMQRKGHVLVAAVGNDGPAAPPLYPAAYPGVVGVTGVSREKQVLPEAAQGPHVMFAALGAAVTVAEPGGGYTLARGTSYAAPLVAGLLAQSLTVPDPEAASLALARLAARATDLGAPGRDPVFGFGLVGVDGEEGRRPGARRRH